MTRKPSIKASIYLYGTAPCMARKPRDAGYYCLGDTSDGRMFGQGEVVTRLSSATAALMYFARIMTGAGVPYNAPLAVHMDIGGVPMMATKYRKRQYGYPDRTMPLTLGTMPYFGDLVWEGGTVVRPDPAVIAMVNASCDDKR